MIISDFRRIDTVTVPDVFMSVVTISDDGKSIDHSEIRTILSNDKELIDYIAIESDSDPLSFPLLYKLIKDIKPTGLKSMLITDGRDPSILDDLVGAGYVDSIDIVIKNDINDDQKKCVEFALDNKRPLYVTLHVRGMDETKASSIASSCKGCKMIILKQDKDQPLENDELKSLTEAVKKKFWNVRMS